MAQQKQLNKPTFLKVKEIQKTRNGFNFYAKVVNATHKTITTSQGLSIPTCQCTLGDETGTVKAFFKGDSANLIKQGNVIAIRNGVKRYVKNFINIGIDIFGRVTLQKDIKIEKVGQLDISIVQHPKPKKDNYRRQNRTYNTRKRDRDNRENRQYRGNRGDKGDSGDRNRQYNNRPAKEHYSKQDQPRRNYNKREEGQSYYRNEGKYQRNEGQYRRQTNKSYQKPYENKRQDRYEPQYKNNKPRYNEQNRQQYRKKYNQRQYERKQQNNKPRYAEKRQDRGQRAPVNWTKIQKILPGDEDLNLNLRIITLQKVQGKYTNYRCKVGDETGVSNAFLPSFLQLKQGDEIVLFNAIAKVVKQHIEIQLPRQGKIQFSKKPINKVSQNYDLSVKAWIPVE